MPIGSAYGPSPTKVEEVDRNGHQPPRLRAPGRFGMAWPGAHLHSIPCGRTRAVGHPMAVRPRVHRHRKPSTDVRPSVDDHGGDRSSGRLASISGGRIARRIRLALVDSQGTASCRTDQGADGPRRQDCRPVHCARGHGFLDGRSGLQPLPHPPGTQSAARLSHVSLLRRCLRRLRREVWLASRGPPGLTGEENNGRRVASSRTRLGPARPGQVQEDPSHRVDQPDKTAWNPLPGRSPPAKFNTEQDIPEMRPSTDPGARRSLTSPGMSGWLEAFLACRGVERPDGRALYAYRCTGEEFGSLAEALSRNPPRGASAKPSAPATRTGTTSRAVPAIAESPALGAARWIRSGRA